MVLSRNRTIVAGVAVAAAAAAYLAYLNSSRIRKALSTAFRPAPEAEEGNASPPLPRSDSTEPRSPPLRLAGEKTNKGALVTPAAVNAGEMRAAGCESVT